MNEATSANRSGLIVLALAIGIVATGILLFGYYYFTSSTTDSVSEDNANEGAMTDGETETPSDSDTVVPGGDATTTPEAPREPGVYTSYGPEKLAAAKEGRVVLFFAASWCPTCQALDGDLNASYSDIPSDLTILKVDYDNSTDLKKKYGITYQHTLIQVDESGNQLKKWSGGNTLETIVEKIS